jgi:hypothetical protein
MIAATVVASAFVIVVTITWLSSRAEAAQARCDDLARHIHRQLEIPPTGRPGPNRPPPGKRR